MRENDIGVYTLEIHKICFKYINETKKPLSNICY